MRIPPTIRVDLDDIVASVGDQLVSNRLLEPARNLLDQMGQQLAILPDHLRDTPCGRGIGRGKAQKGGRSLVEANRKALAGDPHSQLQLRPGYGGRIAPLLCSVLILPTPQGPVFGRNLDWHPRNELASASCRLEYSRGGRMARCHRCRHGVVPQRFRARFELPLRVRV